MKKLKFNLSSLIIFLFLYSLNTNAACIQNSNFKNIITNIPSRTYSIQYDDLATKDLELITIPYGGGNPLYTYSSSNGSCGLSYLHGRYLNGWVPNTNFIAPSNIPGIGISVKTGGPKWFNTSYGPSSGETQSWQVIDSQWSVLLKKTGQVTQSDFLKAGNVADFYQTNPAPHNSTWYLTTLNIPANTIRINVLSCSVKNNTTTYNVNMGDWFDTQFQNIGDTSTAVDIPITLTCMAGANIKATVTSSSGYIDENTGKIALSGTGQAIGIAIQLLDKNNTPIKLNIRNSLQDNVPAGDYLFNWKARYIKTSDVITPGSANATATVNIRYE
ncbi:fimbrial protein BcfF [Providencia rustigianii]|uniref:Fimbrial protein BcfF n=2 Tax=Providencia rustigianii TaxID=158850 RepID=A0A379FZM0_9GAMM|nr:fimbrial protein [Providencia rustigianii]SUC34136.1 fimbrial protein BcfF [Providencia rustigianii]VEB63197.1 fimbrial protein BcfF [Providencia rustigianii]